VDVATLVTDIERRDGLDARRDVSPLVRAADAVEIDTTGRTIEVVVADILARYRAANREAAR
jgi:cytidylate kinase